MDVQRVLQVVVGVTGADAAGLVAAEDTAHPWLYPEGSLEAGQFAGTRAIAQAMLSDEARVVSDIATVDADDELARAVRDCGAAACGIWPVSDQRQGVCGVLFALGGRSMDLGEGAAIVGSLAEVAVALFERHRGYRLYQAAVEHARAGVALADARLPDTPVIYVNEVFTELTGYSAAETVGRNLRFLQAGDCDQPGVRALRRAVDTGTASSVELRNYRKDGRFFRNWMGLAPIRDAGGVLTHFVGVQLDLTPFGGRRPTDRVPRWQHHTSPEIAELADRDPVAVLPVAAIEQHGPHLPLSTDLDIAEGVLHETGRWVPAEVPWVVLPSLAVGASSEHADFPGTLTVDSGAVAEHLFRVGASLAASGIRRLVVWNTHGGNRAAVDQAALRLRREYGLLVVKTEPERLGLPEGVDEVLGGREEAIHGGGVETALMRFLHPDRVRDDSLPSSEEAPRFGRIGPGGEGRFAWLAGDLGEDGIVGNPSLAGAAVGQRLVEHYGERVAGVIGDAYRFPLEKLSKGTRRI